MAEEFTPITFNTQEEFDAAFSADGFKDRISRMNRKHGEEKAALNGTIEQLTAEAESLKAQLESLNGNSEKLTAYEKEIEANKAEISALRISAVKRDIAEEFGIPKEMAARLNGTDEESIRADAETMAKLFANNHQIAPLASVEVEPINNTKSTLNEWLKSQKN